MKKSHRIGAYPTSRFGDVWEVDPIPQTLGGFVPASHKQRQLALKMNCKWNRWLS